MYFINTIFTFPGRIIANLLYDYLGVVWLIVFAVIIGLLVLGSLYKKKEIFHIALIIISIFLAFTPSVFKFVSYDSKLFWAFIFSSTVIGFIYYFMNKGDNLAPASIVQEDNPEVNTGLTPLNQEMNPQSRSAGKYVFYKNHYIFLAVLILGLAFYLRIFQIDKYPAGYSFWELNTPLGIIDYDSGRNDFNHYLQLFKINYAYFSNYSPIVMGLAVPFYKILDISLVTGRYFSVVWGIAGLLLFFLYLRELFPLEYSIFLLAFPSLELVNVTFSRIGYYHITSFTYSVLMLYLSEITFKQRRPIFSVLLAFYLGLGLFGVMYVYHPAKAIMLIVIVILFYKMIFRKGFFVQNRIPLAVFFVTFSLAIYGYTQGDLRALWPQYTGYLSIDKNTSMIEFLKEAFITSQANLKITFYRIVFSERAIDSLSKFKDGGLISGPALCFIPFAVGFALAGIRRERNFAIMVMIAVALLPPIFGYPNASRLLLFLSLLLILPGITVYFLFDQIQRVLDEKKKEFAVLIPALFFIFLFSYNLYIFIDINSNMMKKNSVAVPFAESGFDDKIYSRFITALAKEINGFMKHNNVFFYYSDTFNENATAPNGAYEQFLIESYNNSNKGKRLVWMNPFHLASPGYMLSEKPHFHQFETVLSMVLASDRDVKVIFIKPLADEMGIYEKLKAFIPGSIAEKRTGDAEDDKVVILSIPHSRVDQIKNDFLVPLRDKTSDIFSGKTISHLIKENIKNDFSFDGYFILEKDSKIQFNKDVTGLLDITIDNYKSTEQPQHLSLLKGVHRLKIKFIDKEPFTINNINEDKLQDFSARFVTVSKPVDVFSSKTISRLIKENIKNDFSFDGYFLLEKDHKVLFNKNVAGLFDITIDDYKSTEKAQHLSLLKGVHRVKIKFVDKEPFTINNINADRLREFSAPFISVSEAIKLTENPATDLYPHTWSVEKSIPYNPDPAYFFYYNFKDNQYVFSNHSRLLSSSGQPLVVEDFLPISKILQKDDRTFTLRYFLMEYGQLAVYDSNYKKNKDIKLTGHPFDFFFGNNGDLYITYLNRDKITIIKPDYTEEIWDTSFFSDFPIWNGAVDEKNGDIILLSGDRKVFVFDRNRNFQGSFDVATAWSVSPELIRYGGGMIITNGIIHILDPDENSIKSYNKVGHRLYSDKSDSLFIIPSNFTIDFMQGLNGTILLAGRTETGEKKLLFLAEKNEANSSTL
jgi:hypothetical protein